ncbi:hypothetical protein FT663_01983 [Candidozyma haemuli var. vulneris]|uniref:Uridylate kinase n=1 Tax=Candidozyma haemuli TaxID=45357 RepID=A0A2V1ATB9_9ASCO|nr:hypothetical protein CXQ85_000043 [[Candida] haemuloni]KAF3988636.1 hypothetical protein FT662_03315 [[Candida] haemuloni var. vulneris]KAF3993235.1 hypothetical protein FT663_01983 [[Candida] haemuloni var. vulneris]PVH21078.1 hypothetical protein CXQ85_000043 [[Candida] haemuloni]
MFVRSLRTASLKAPARLLPARVSLVTPLRHYSKFSPERRKASKKAKQSSEESSEEKPKKTDAVKSAKGYMLGALALLVIASTIGASVYTTHDPRSAPEPTLPAQAPEETKSKDEKKAAAPAFSDKDVSVIFVLGGPGSGKGTQCGKLVEEKGFVHLSAGDLLRAEQVREGSSDGALIAKCIREGTIVPQEVTVRLLRNAVSDNVAQGNNKFLVDGFPRKMDQALTFEDEIVKSAFTLFFECKEQVMLDRLLERGKTSGRADDNIESIKKRFRTFIETSMPVVDYFDKQGKVVKLSCDQPVDVVFGKVKEALVNRGIN